MIDNIVFNSNKQSPRPGIPWKMVDRGTPWGNPFVMGIDGTREEVIDLFGLYANWRLTVQPLWLYSLRGCDLGCHCNPLPCHAHILLRLLKGLSCLD